MALILGLLLVSASAAADTGLKIVIDHCNDIDADEIGSMVAADFQDANEGKSTITISCEGQIASLRLLEAGTTKELERSVDLTGIDPVARPRTLAVLVVELLETWQPEPAPRPAPEPRADPPPVAKPAEWKSTAEVPKSAQSPSLRQPIFVVGLGLGIGSRSFGYRVAAGVTDAANIRPYQSPVVPMSQLGAQVYPFTKMPAVAGLGLSGRYAATRSVTSKTADNVELNTKFSSWDFNLRYQRIFSFAMIGADLGVGNERFLFSGDPSNAGTLLEEVPAINIRYNRLALDADIPLTQALGLVADLEYRIVGGLGDLAENYVETNVVAWAGQLGAHYWIKSDLRAELVYSRASYTYTFIEATGQTEATGDDIVSSTLLGLRWQR